ncbi:biosynthetic-type acetolactate synthase large subunit [Armatimonas rosea]|uniref:Acetolactate synthase n=1 Tax=Armatimonas rosea TaxID=685828 RepID=A0A7W9SR56_ARMRO|nr:acetolactate synthase-1/2/3 large subunit [Armatimonas rosea]
MAKIKSTGAKAVLECMRREGVEIMFGYPGGAVIPFYDELYHCDFLHHVLVRHEQGGGHMAEGYAHATGKVGVCLGTSGPGATNLVTPLCDAMMDSIPLVAITGQVRTEVIGKDAFQEADITGITMPVTKHNWLVKDANELPRIMHEAFHIARSGRPGPVLVDIPVDVFRAVIEYDPDEAQQVSIRSFKSDFKVHPLSIKRAAELIAEAKKPVLYVGGGAKAAGAHAELLELTRRTNIPVTTTLHGLGTFPEDSPLSLGMLGMHGTAYANYAVHNCDLLISVGARFDDRVTGKVSAFAPEAKVIHMDIDPGEINKVRRADAAIVGDCKAALTELLKLVKDANDFSEWHDEIGKWKAEFPLEAPDGTEDGIIHAEFAIRELARLTDHNVTVVTDVGQHQMWAAQHFGTRKPRQFITSGGLGTMGFGLPAAIGASFASQGKEPVWCISGDGSIQMCIQELMVASIYKLPVKVMILNNQFLGMVRQWQEMFWQKHYSSVNLEQAPDFVKLAEAYGILGLICDKPEELEATLRRAMEHDGPVVMDIRVAKESNVFPMIPSGQTINEMMVRKPEPELAPPSVCHFEPKPKDTRVPDPDEVVDVAR